MGGPEGGGGGGGGDDNEVEEDDSGATDGVPKEYGRRAGRATNELVAGARAGAEEDENMLARAAGD